MIYARLCCWVNRMVVCTTAGDVVVLDSGKEISRSRTNGEIWSGPIVFKGTDDSEMRLAFGARDSILHIIQL